MSMMDELYQQVILEHNRHARNFHGLDRPTHQAEGYNPLCGDHYHVYLEIDDQGIIERATFEGQGCAISKASLSIMTETLQGRTPAEARSLFKDFHDLVTGRSILEATQGRLGKLAVFSGISRFPTRVKCAVLGWHALLGALDRSQDPVTTE